MFLTRKSIFTLSFLLFASCYENQTVEVPRDVDREINSGLSDTDDSLVLPGKTTGTFLTMFCHWEKYGSDKENASTKCRIEDSNTKEKYRGAVIWDAKIGDSSILKDSQPLPYSNSQYSARVAFTPGYQDKVKIEAYFSEYDKKMSVRPSEIEFSSFPAFIVGEPLLYSGSDSAFESARDELDDFLSPSAFCTYGGTYHKDSINRPIVDFSKMEKYSSLAQHCDKGIGAAADFLAGIVLGDGDPATETDFNTICKHHKKPLSISQNITDFRTGYCRVLDLKYISKGISSCAVLNVAKISEVDKAKSGELDRITHTILVFAAAEINSSNYLDSRGLKLGKDEFVMLSQALPSCDL